MAGDQSIQLLSIIFGSRTFAHECSAQVLTVHFQLSPGLFESNLNLSWEQIGAPKTLRTLALQPTWEMNWYRTSNLFSSASTKQDWNCLWTITHPVKNKLSFYVRQLAFKESLRVKQKLCLLTKTRKLPCRWNPHNGTLALQTFTGSISQIRLKN